MPTFNRVKEIWQHSYFIHKDIEKKYQVLTKFSLNSKAMRNIVLHPLFPSKWNFFKVLFCTRKKIIILIAYKHLN